MSYAGVNIQGGICYTRTGEGKQFVLTNTGLILYELMFKRKRAAVVAKQGYE